MGSEPVNDKKLEISYEELYEMVNAASFMLKQKGVKKGDVVLYGKYAGQELTIDGEDFLLVAQTDILFIA